MGAPEVDANHYLPVAHALRGEVFDAGEDGTGRGTPLVPVAFHNRQDPDVSGDITHPLGAKDNGMAVAQPVAFRDTADCLTSAYGTKWNGNASADNGSLFAAQPVALQDVREINKAQNGRGWNDDGTAYTVDTRATQGVAVAQPVATDLYNGAIDGDATHSLRVGNGNAMGGVPSMLHAMQVRRLTPVECERLQGFPDGYTAIPWRGKSADQCPDGPRYKALGNSWAVPCVRWIGARIHREMGWDLA